MGDESTSLLMKEERNKILVVDDSASVVQYMRDILQNGYYVKTASSGEDALTILSTYSPDIILLDVSMGGINGYEVCRTIREKGKHGFVKIIMVSSGTSLNERLKGYESGADDYIGKPFKEEELLAKVRVFIRLKTVEDQLKDLNDKLNDQIKLRTKQLIDAEKMAAIGRYAAGIVHNLNNPLQVIMGTSQLLSMKNPNDKNIMRQRKAAAEMKKIIASILKTGVMESKTESVKIDLNDVLNSQIELLRSDRFFKHHIHVERDLNPLPPYLGIYAHFSQSFSNLMKNAGDAMYDRDNCVLKISSGVEDNHIVIRISDSGHGISKEAMGRIFDPFFTTKPLTANDDRPTGTGLGLASCKEMIESYGGEITVDSVIDEGAVFTVKLPLTEDTV